MNQQQHARLRSQFPALAQEVNGHPLVYLDNAATTQKSQVVLDAIAHYYQADNANVHRAAHALSGRATRAFEAARETVSRFINAPHSREVIWTRGTTEAINLVAQSWGMSELKAGDENHPQHPGAPCQHRPLAADCPAYWRRDPGHPPR